MGIVRRWLKAVGSWSADILCIALAYLALLPMLLIPSYRKALKALTKCV